ncbi:hypothetical protein CCACVL1_24956 [Corchorus capsularis]|uniref:Uncharacterized protein n=1 Tax=Corchorus capsularis TaxID=210143 RepID=A0A1R3GMJ2_COCAP|nr:hypothetical protein CCACVL1_24956 [Corchorus capsularis]
MARQLLFTPPSPLNASQAGLAALTFLLCAFVLIIKCASHTRKLRHRWRACYEFFEDPDPVIEIIPAGVDVYNQPEDVVDTSTFSREQPVWQKNILMGGKCQLPDFSGVILYDSEGNVVPHSKTPPLLTWK